MILKNYWNIMNDIMTKASPTANILGTAKRLSDGFDVQYQVGGNNSAYAQGYVIQNANMKGDISFRVGTGTTEPTIDDYGLANDVTSSFTGMTVSVSSVVSEGAKVVYLASGTNNTGSDITIKEVGIAKDVKKGESGSPTVSTVLLTRDVLASPITVEAGQGFAFTYEWNEG